MALMSKEVALVAIDDSIEHWIRMRKDPIGAYKKNKEEPNGDHCALCEKANGACPDCALGQYLTLKYNAFGCDDRDIGEDGPRPAWTTASEAFYAVIVDWVERDYIEGVSSPITQLNSMGEWKKESAKMIHELKACRAWVEAGGLDEVLEG